MYCVWTRAALVEGLLREVKGRQGPQGFSKIEKELHRNRVMKARSKEPKLAGSMAAKKFTPKIASGAQKKSSSASKAFIGGAAGQTDFVSEIDSICT